MSYVKALMKLWKKKVALGFISQGMLPKWCQVKKPLHEKEISVIFRQNQVKIFFKSPQRVWCRNQPTTPKRKHSAHYYSFHGNIEFFVIFSVLEWDVGFSLSSISSIDCEGLIIGDILCRDFISR